MAEITVRPLPLIVRGKSGLRQVVELTAAEIPDVADSVLQVETLGETENWPAGVFTAGQSRAKKARIDIPIREVDLDEGGRRRELAVTWQSASGEALARWQGWIDPVRRWQVYIVPHSHCDVGFTHPASEVVEIHNKNMDLALAAIELTRDWPEPARFRWTVETSWQLANYRRGRGTALLSRLIKEAKAGNIEITAAYLHEHFDILGDNQMHRITWEAEGWREYGLPCQTAMLSDIPGASWGLVPVLESAGVKYLVMAPNNFSAPFHTFEHPPRPFYWRGPGREKLLVWYTGDPYWAYIEGARYGLLESFSETEKKLPGLLMELDEEYPFNELMLQLAFDNDRLHITPAEIVRTWNETYIWPRLRLATPSDFFQKVESQHKDRLPEFRGDWPSWWISATTAYPKEAAASRRAHYWLQDVEALAVMADYANEAYAYPHFDLTDAYHDLLTFDEHSGLGGVWIAFSQDKQDQALAEGLDYLRRPLATLPVLERKAVESICEKIQAPKDGCVLVLNPSFSPRSGLTLLKVPEPVECLDHDPNWQRLRHPWFMGGAKYDEEGNLKVGESDEAVFYLGHVSDVPAASYSKIEPQSSPKPASPLEAGENMLESEHYTVRFGSNRPIESIIDRHTGRELVNDREFPFGAVVRYREKRSSMDLPDGDFQARKDLYEGIPGGGEVKAVYPDPEGRRALQTEIITAGSQAAAVRKSLTGSDLNVVWETWVYRHSRRFDLVLRLKRDQLEPERDLLYVALPFNLVQPRCRHQVAEAVTEPGQQGQLPGSCMDFYSIGDWVQLSDDNASVTMCSLDALLVDYGGIHLNQFLRGDWAPDSGLTLLRLAWTSDRWNNLGGDEELVFRFSFTSGAEPLSGAGAGAFAAEVLHPLRSFWLPAKPKIQNEWEQPGSGLIEIGPESVQCTHLFRGEEPATYILWLVETSGKEVEASLRFPMHRVSRVQECTPAGHPLPGRKVKAGPDDIYTLQLMPYQTKVLKATLIR